MGDLSAQPTPSPPSPLPWPGLCPGGPAARDQPCEQRRRPAVAGSSAERPPEDGLSGQRVPTELPGRPLTCRVPRTRLPDQTSPGHPLRPLGQPVAETDAQGSERTCSGHPAGAGPPEPALPPHCLPGDAAPWRVARMMTPTPAEVHLGTQRRPRLKLEERVVEIGHGSV